MSKRVLILTDKIGHGDEKLGALLMKNFLYSLARNEAKPKAVMFMNEGVRLTCEGSESLEDLQLLADAGVAVKSCGTCLDYFNLKDSLKIGEIGTMPGSVEALMSDDNVLTIA